jgi:cytoskeletal protein CcmA (bactofilin family)
MWNKLTDREPKPIPQANLSLSEPRQPITASAPPQQTAKAVLGKTVRIKGELFSEEELQIDGQFDGTIESKSRITIGAEGKVIANIKAVEIVVSGIVQGNVEARDRVIIRKGAHIIGDVRTAGIAIDDGAYFKGGIDITRGEA